MFTLPISSGRTCQVSEAGLHGRSAMLSTGGEMYSLNLPLIRLRAVSQRVGDGGLTGRVTVLGGNSDDAFLFWATCSTGTSMVTGGSTGAVGGRVDPDFDEWGRIHLSRPRLGRPGWRSWASVARRDRHRWFSHQLWNPLDFPGSSWLGWRRHKRRDRRRQFSCRFWFPLGRPWRAWLLPSRPLPPLVSINQRNRAPAATEGNTELGQLAKSRQHRPQGGGRDTVQVSSLMLPRRLLPLECDF